MKSYQSIAALAGAPRSGTSWLGQIVESSPRVAYRYQPFFSHALKGMVDSDSSREQWLEFFEALYRSDDDFLLQRDQRRRGIYPTFDKMKHQDVLCFKETRYHYLLSPMLRKFDDIKLICIVRHPSAVITSWIRSPKEFPPGSDVQREWRFGACKNGGREENFFGYFKWKELAHIFLDLHSQWPSRVRIVRYEDLVGDLPSRSEQLFEFLGLEVGPSTRQFLSDCHNRSVDDAYSVFKPVEVRDRWREQLPHEIQQEIEDDLKGTSLEIFVR